MEEELSGIEIRRNIAGFFNVRVISRLHHRAKTTISVVFRFQREKRPLLRTILGTRAIILSKSERLTAFYRRRIISPGNNVQSRSLISTLT